MSFVPHLVALTFEPKDILGYIEPQMSTAFEKVQPLLNDLPIAVPSITPIESLLVVLIIAYVCHTLAVFPTAIAAGGLDNTDPRGMAAKAKKKKSFFSRLSSYLLGAHYNTLESFMVYAVGVILCTVTEVDKDIFQKICHLYVITRVAFCVAYAAQIIPLLSVPISLVRSSFYFSNTICACMLLKLAAMQK
eukprot:jgi/Bigna1/88436/estExt_fgenesh1_pg.C_320025